jgi:hypothetical protein
MLSEIISQEVQQEENKAGHPLPFSIYFVCGIFNDTGNSGYMVWNNCVTVDESERMCK